jgi:ATP-dependent helicase/nuclease subunit B
MSVEYLLGPAASGKTHTCVDRVRAMLADRPLAEVWVVVPDRTKAISFRRRLASQGGALGATIGTFPDLFRELLARAGEFVPIAPEPVVHRMVRSAIDSLQAAGELPYYAPIRRTPGFIRAMAEHIAEFKRAMIPPDKLAAALVEREPRLREMAAIYRRYQEAMQALGWADREGAGWLAVRALTKQADLLPSMDLLVVDGFDSFSPLQLETLAALAQRAGTLLITLSGEPEMDRPAYRRFERTHQRLLERFAAAPTRQTPDHSRPEVLRHLERSLFAAAARAVEGAGRVTLIEAQTQALEAREALRWLKARIQRDGESPAECAIIAPDLRPYQAHIREVAREFELPVRFVLGDALESNPAIASVMNLLHLPLLEWPRRLLLNVVSSPYFDLGTCGFVPDDAWRLDEVAQAAQVIHGLAQWHEGLAMLAQAEPAQAVDEELTPLRAPHGEEALRLWRAIEQLAKRLTPLNDATLAEHARWVRELLADEGGFALERQARAGTERGERDLAALETLRQQMDALVLSERALPHPAPVAFREFVDELRGAVQAAGYQPEADQAWRGSRIYASDLAQARGVPFHAVVLLGMAEGLFPAPLKEDPFLTDSDREGLREKGLPLEPRLRSDQQTLFYEAVTRAERYLLLTRPYLSAEGETWEPSPYWEELRGIVQVEPQHVRNEAPLALHDAASRLELLAQALLRESLPEAFAELGGDWRNVRHARDVLHARLAREAEGEFDGRLSTLSALLRVAYGPQHLFSPGRLEIYAGCKFHFLVQKVLGLEERAEPQEGFDPAQLGTMLHEILEQVYAGAPQPSHLEALLESLEPVAERVFTDAPRRLGFRPSPLWAAERAALLEDLRLTVKALDEFAAGYRPVRLEAAFGMGSPPLRLQTEAGEILLHGIIDRVDADAGGGIRVIDYKTGAGRLDMKNLQQGRRLQITLYGLAGEEVLGLGRLADGVYWKIRQAEPSSLRLSELNYTSEEGHSFVGVRGAADLARMYVGRYVSGIREGDFRPQPPEGGCPNYCPARLFCWRYEPG